METVKGSRRADGEPIILPTDIGASLAQMLSSAVSQTGVTVRLIYRALTTEAVHVWVSIDECVAAACR
eukprot:3839395-Prorocentrum_lima.AAC.1